METISIIDGLGLTITAMLVVLIVLGSIWGLVELVAKFMVETTEPVLDAPSVMKPPTMNQTTENSKHKKVAEIIALVIASEDQPNKKFEIVESKRIK